MVLQIPGDPRTHGFCIFFIFVDNDIKMFHMLLPPELLIQRLMCLVYDLLRINGAVFVNVSAGIVS